MNAVRYRRQAVWFPRQRHGPRRRRSRMNAAPLFRSYVETWQTWSQLGWRFSEMLFASSQVIAHRTDRHANVGLHATRRRQTGIRPDEAGEGGRRSRIPRRRWQWSRYSRASAMPYSRSASSSRACPCCSRLLCRHSTAGLRASRQAGTQRCAALCVVCEQARSGNREDRSEGAHADSEACDCQCEEVEESAVRVG